MSDNAAALEAVVERELPHLVGLPPDLLARAFDPVLQRATLIPGRGPSGERIVPRPVDDYTSARPLPPMAVALLRAEGFAVRRRVCAAHADGLVGDVLDKDNVTALVLVLCAALGVSGEGIPTGVMAGAVLLLKIGLKRYCRWTDEAQVIAGTVEVLATEHRPPGSQ